MAPEVEIEVRSTPVHHVTGDTFVLCSDGLSDLARDQEILETVRDAPPAQAVGTLVDLANARGGHDNITVLVLRARTTAVEIAGAGVAPTIAQTRVPQGGETGQTIVEPSGERVDATEAVPMAVTPHGSVHPVPQGPPAHTGTARMLAQPPMGVAPLAPPSAPPHPAPRRGPMPAALVVAFGLGGVAIAVLTAVVAIRIADRARRMMAPAVTDAGMAAPLAPASDAENDATSDRRSSDASRPAAPLTPLVAGSIEVTVPSVPAEPLAPLEPTPDEHRPPHRKKKQ